MNYITENENEWNDQYDDLQNAQVSREIEKSLQYLNMLKSQKEELQSKLDSINEDSTSNFSSKYKVRSPVLVCSSTPSSSVFFKTIEDLENLNEELKSQYESEQQISSELAHQKNILQQKIKKIQNSLNVYKAQLKSEESRSRVQYDSLQYVEEKLEKEEDNNDDELQNMNILQNDLISLTKQIQNQTRETLDELEGRIQDLQNELEDKKFTKKALQKDLEELQNVMKKQQEQFDEKLGKAKNVRYMQNTQIYLASRIRSLEEQIKIARNDYYASVSRESSISDAFQSMFPNDKGDGECDEIKRMIQGKINQVESNVSYGLQEELDIEIDFEKELNKQLELVENTIQTINENHEQKKKSLLDELDECQEDGYVKLLRKEMIDIQEKASKS